MTNIELGRQRPQIEILRALVTILQVNPRWLLTGQGAMFERLDEQPLNTQEDFMIAEEQPEYGADGKKSNNIAALLHQHSKDFARLNQDISELKQMLATKEDLKRMQNQLEACLIALKH